jgi:hypothetical protein
VTWYKIAQGAALDSREKIEYWLDLAEYDLGSAKVMQRAVDICMSVSCASKPLKKL